MGYIVSTIDNKNTAILHALENLPPKMNKNDT